MAWLYLLLAGFCEVGWAVGLKYVEGWSRPLALAGTGAAMLASLAFLWLAMKSIPLGTAYAVWTGIGTVGTVLFGIAFFAEPADALRLICIGLIVAGVVGLKALSTV